MPEGLWEEDYEYLRQESWRLIWPSRKTMIDIYHNAVTSANEDEDGSDEERPPVGSWASL